MSRRRKVSHHSTGRRRWIQIKTRDGEVHEGRFDEKIRGDRAFRMLDGRVFLYEDVISFRVARPDERPMNREQP